MDFILLVIALLIFGKRLPEVARSLGKGIVEFKKGLRGVEDDIDESVNRKPGDRVLPRSETQDTAGGTASHEAERTGADSHQ